jgi:PAS domain S-box-containing protein
MARRLESWTAPGLMGREGGEDELDRALDRNVSRAVPPIVLALAAYYLLLSAFHMGVLGSEGHSVLAWAAGASALLLLVARAALHLRSSLAGRGHVAGALVAVLVLSNAFVEMVLTGEPWSTTYALLVILGVGLFFLDWGWFALVAVLALTGWFLAAVPHLPDREWVHFGLSLLMATGLSAIVLHLRRGNLVRLEELRMKERVRQIELESALDQTERARKGGEEARRAMETAIVQVKESEERFRRLAEATFEGVIFYRDGKILDANPRAAQYFGVAVSQMVGDPVLNLLAPQDRDGARDGLLAPLGPGDPSRAESMEVSARRYDGSLFQVEVSVVDSLYQGHPARVMVVRDVTNQKRAERMLRRALEEAEANALAKNTFLANMSHELRTPLNSVIGFANILLKKQGDSLPPRELDFLRRIQSNGEHLLSLIEDILDLSKMDAQRLEVVREPVDLEALAGEVVRTLDLQARRKGLELTVEVPPGLPPTVADHRRLRQVLLNLVGNAVKFTAEGRVAIRVIADQDRRRPLRIEVEDTEIGIPAGELDEIFTPFHQVDQSRARAFGGTGLGLTISRSLCDLMGFQLRARSIEGEGSTFIVDLDPDVAPSPGASRRERGAPSLARSIGRDSPEA